MRCALHCMLPLPPRRWPHSRALLLPGLTLSHTTQSHLATGDVSVLSGLKDKLASGRHSLSKRMFSKRGAPAKGGSPSKDTLRNTVHVSRRGRCAQSCAAPSCCAVLCCAAPAWLVHTGQSCVRAGALPLPSS